MGGGGGGQHITHVFQGYFVLPLYSILLYWYFLRLSDYFLYFFQFLSFFIYIIHCLICAKIFALDEITNGMIRLLKNKSIFSKYKFFLVFSKNYFNKFVCLIIIFKIHLCIYILYCNILIYYFILFYLLSNFLFIVR